VEIDELNQSGLASKKNINSIFSHNQEGRMSTGFTKTNNNLIRNAGIKIYLLYMSKL
jgi:hypothetical protein